MNYKQLPELTKRQKELVDFVYRFRFINRKQIQKILNHKDPKRINIWLKDLVEKGYLGRIYSHKLLENTKPAIYYLNNNAILWVRYEKGLEYGSPLEQLDFKYLKKFYEDKHASQTFINHCTSLFDFYIQLKEEEKKSKKLDYEIGTKTELWIIEKLHVYKEEDFENIKEIIPDIYIEKFKNPEQENISSQSYFLQLFDPGVPRYALRYKVDQYIKFNQSGEWKHKFSGLDGKFPLLLLIFPTQQKLNQIGKYIKKQLDSSYDLEAMTFMLTTCKQAIEEGLGNDDIWTVVKEA
jgi:hypothetical protein